MKYPGIICKEENGYWIEFPDLKGYVTEGDTMEELMSNVDEILFLYLECNDRNNLPEPSELTGDNIIYVDIFEAYRRESEKELQEWIKLRENGWTFQRIANKYHVSKQYVCDRLDKAGVKRKTKWSWAYEQWEELYKNGTSLTKIAKDFNCSKSTVYEYIKKKFVINKSEAGKKGWATRKMQPITISQLTGMGALNERIEQKMECVTV